jgi:hypothetical protein
MGATYHNATSATVVVVGPGSDADIVTIRLAHRTYAATIDTGRERPTEVAACTTIIHISLEVCWAGVVAEFHADFVANRQGRIVALAGSIDT